MSILLPAPTPSFPSPAARPGSAGDLSGEGGGTGTVQMWGSGMGCIPQEGGQVKGRDWEATFEEERSQAPGSIPTWEEDLAGK